LANNWKAVEKRLGSGGETIERKGAEGTAVD